MTPLVNFYRPVRALLGDRNAQVRRYPDAALADAVRTVVQLNKVPDHLLDLTELGIEPTITDPNLFALVCYHVGRLFVAPDPAGRSWRTKDFSESLGDTKHFLAALEMEIHNLENGTAFQGWSALHHWFHTHTHDAALTLPVTFTQDGVLVPGDYLLGAPVWGQPMLLTSARALGWTSQGADTVLALEVAGVRTAFGLTLLAGAANTEVQPALSLSYRVAAGEMVRWIVVSGPAEEAAAAWHVTVTVEAQPTS